MQLLDLLARKPDRMVFPLMGYPGLQLTGSTLWQNENNWALHARSILALAERFAPDAIFPFMDLSIEAGAIGLPVQYPLHESPTVTAHPVNNAQDLEPLRVPDIQYDARVISMAQTVAQLKREFAGPVGAYVSGPFTLAGLMMSAEEVAIATRKNPDLVHAAVALATETILQYARLLLDVGADMIAILEPTASFISPKAFQTFSGQYISQIIDALDTITILHICGDTTHLLNGMAATGVHGLSLDAQVDMALAAQTVPAETVLIGNVDPVLMATGDAAAVQAAVMQLAESMQPYPNFILSTGCDLPPETPLENIAAFMQAARLVPAPRGGVVQP